MTSSIESQSTSRYTDTHPLYRVDVSGSKDRPILIDRSLTEGLVYTDRLEDPRPQLILLLWRLPMISLGTVGMKRASLDLHYRYVFGDGREGAMSAGKIHSS